MGTQKIQTQNGNTREKLVQDAKKEAHAAGGNLAEAVIKFVERTADQLRYEDIQALDKKTEDAKKQITTLTAAHSALSKRQEEVESSQKTVVKTVNNLQNKHNEEMDTLRKGVESVSNGIGSLRKSHGETDEKIKTIAGELDKKSGVEEVTQLIGEALTTHTKFRDQELEKRFVMAEELEHIATKSELNELRDSNRTLNDAVDEALRVAKDAYSVAVDAEAKADGANTQANGAFAGIREISSDVDEIRTSMAPQPAKATDTPDEAKSAPGVITVTKTEVEQMIKKAVVAVLGKIANLAEFAESPKDLADYIKQELEDIMGG